MPVSIMTWVHSNICRGIPALACGYFENQFAHERTPEVLYVMASICAESGLYVKAAGYYQDLVKSGGQRSGFIS